MKKLKGLTILAAFAILTACSSASTTSPTNKFNSYTPVITEAATDKIEQYDGEPSRVYKNVYTTARKMALTFDGLPEQSQLEKVLEELDRIDAKATFFVSGIRAAAEPELLQTIEQAGHEVQSLGLSQLNYNEITYQEKFKNFSKGKETLEQRLGHEVQYVRAAPTEMVKQLALAAAHSGHEAIIGYSLFLKDSSLDEQFLSAKDLRLYVTRGGIVNIDIERNSRIAELLELVKQAAAEVSYELVTVSNLLTDELEFKSYEELVPNDYIGIKPVSEAAAYTVIESGDPTKKEVALTLDDWGTDYTVTTIMDLLQEYDVPATFYLRANGAERNPSLARAILDAGFEVANHSYSHPVITTITDEEIQQEVVQAHRAITEALQQAPLILFRPPTGVFDERSARAVASTGYTTIANFNLTTYDWDTSNDAQSIVDITMENLQNGSIMLYHILDDLHTIEALPQIIEKVREQGYTFVPMSKMIEEAQQ